MHYKVKVPASGHFLEYVEADSKEDAIRKLRDDLPLNGQFEPECVDYGLSVVEPELCPWCNRPIEREDDHGQLRCFDPNTGDPYKQGDT